MSQVEYPLGEKQIEHTVIVPLDMGLAEDEGIRYMTMLAYDEGEEKYANLCICEKDFDKLLTYMITLKKHWEGIEI